MKNETNEKTKQARKDAKELKSHTRAAIRTLKRAHANLLARGVGAEEFEGYDGPDARANERLQEKVGRAIEPLDECLDAVTSRRVLGRQREPSEKETRSERYARRCEAVAGRALKTLLQLQEELDNGDWLDAMSTAEDGVQTLRRDLDSLGTLRDYCALKRMDKALAQGAKAEVVEPVSVESLEAVIVEAAAQEAAAQEAAAAQESIVDAEAEAEVAEAPTPPPLETDAA